MNTKLGLNIHGRRFDVDVENDFAPFLKEQMAKDFNVDGNNDLKTLLQAYIRKNHELFVQDAQMKEIIKKLDNLG